MSTQRRESRWRRMSCIESAKALGHTNPALIARNTYADASGGTAPPASSARLATNSLQLGYRIVRLFQIVRQEVRQFSPPFVAGAGAATGTPAIHGSSPPHIPSPTGYACIHSTLPWVPAG
jgi:hypothetical protein